MIVWLDAQLPLALARWLTGAAAVSVHRIRDMRPRPVKDIDIFRAAGAAGAIVISKDEDFVDLVARLGPPPQVVHLTCGNLTKKPLIAYLEVHWTEVARRLEAGEALVVM